MMRQTLLETYLSKACRGDAEASFNAGKLMAEKGTYNEVIVQKRFLDAANAGYAKAQKELAGLGLYGSLVAKNSTVTNIHYCENLNEAFMWLHRAASNGNAECQIALQAIDRYGTDIVYKARAAVEFYIESSCSSVIKKSVSDFIIFEIGLQYLYNIKENEENVNIIV